MADLLADPSSVDGLKVAAQLASTLLVFAAAAAIAAPRSPAVRAEFQRVQPCPATGERRGPCPGWQVDHIQALKCGGRDAPDNMQWLTVEAHREKTRRDMRGCRHRIE